MVITLEDITSMRAKGMAWHEIGDDISNRTGREPRLEAERARTIYRRQRGEIALPTEDNTSKRHTTHPNGDETSEIKKDNPPTTTSTREELLTAHGFDHRCWDVKESVASIRNGKWSSRVKAMPKPYEDVPSDTMSRAILDSVTRMPALKEIRRPHTAPARVAILPLYDIHFGRQFYVDGVALDHEDTTRTVMALVDKFVQRAQVTGVDSITVVVGQDFLNADTMIGTTTKGTPQQNSLPWHEMFSQGLALALWVIERCRRVARVELIYSEGNHDRMMSFFLAQAIKERYRDALDVDCDMSATPRKYSHLGQTLVGYTHGSDESKLSTIMQNEVPHLWGKTKYRYWITGHLHHLEIGDTDGTTVIRCPSPTFHDEWTIRKGFIGAQIQQSGFVITPDGMEEIWLFTE